MQDNKYQPLLLLLSGMTYGGMSFITCYRQMHTMRWFVRGAFPKLSTHAACTAPTNIPPCSPDGNPHPLTTRHPYGRTCNMRLHASGESFEVEGWVIHGAECCPADMVTKARSQSRQASPFHSLRYRVCPAMVPCGTRR